PSRPVGCGPYLCTESARFVLRPGICSGAGPLIPNGTLETLRRRPPGGNFGCGSAFARCKCATAALPWWVGCRLSEHGICYEGAAGSVYRWTQLIYCGPEKHRWTRP